MNKFRHFGIGMAILISIFTLGACELARNNAKINIPTPAAAPPPPPAASATEKPLSVQAAIERIDEMMERNIEGEIAYNAPPPSMNLDQITTIQLLLSPSLSANELEQQITENGSVISATLDISERMSAELIASDPDAFNIQAFHKNAEQLVGKKEPTEWKWQIQAKKEGKQTLTLVLYTLYEYEGFEKWHHEVYKNNIDVNVTLGQRLKQFDWKWLMGILLIPLLWRWVDQRKKNKPDEKPGLTAY